jgi:NADP-dependent 3-hydroxy acid dehydrogenase YdfG
MNAKPVALVTGATGGIGQAVAFRLHSRQYAVIGTGRNPQALDILRARGVQTRALDVTDESAVVELVADIRRSYGRLDVLVNNAGIGFASPLEQAALSDLRSIFETNVVAMLHLSQAVLPGMRARGTGTIVNIGSTGGRFTTPGAGAYHISKYAVEALSLALRAEVKSFGIRVVLIEPTGVRTKFADAQLCARQPNPHDDPYLEFKKRYADITRAMAETPLVSISPDSVARVVVRAVEARNPKPRYIVGASGKASVLARMLLTDRMWDRLLMRGLSSRSG